jgi:hypothetical protein
VCFQLERFCHRLGDITFIFYLKSSGILQIRNYTIGITSSSYYFVSYLSIEVLILETVSRQKRKDLLGEIDFFFWGGWGIRDMS